MSINNKKIPKPSVLRLCSLYRLLEDLESEGITTVYSNELGRRLGVEAHNIRKDISYLGEIGNFSAGYNIAKLKVHIADKLGIAIERRACVVGLGRLGMAIMNYAKFMQGPYYIVAGFDSNINKLETLQTKIKVYPAYMIPEIVRSQTIELAIITTPASAAQEIAERLIDSGIRGIVNFTDTFIKTNNRKAVVRNIDVNGEFRIISALLFLERAEKK